MPEVLPQAASDLMAYLENPTLQIVARLGINPIPLGEAPLALSDMVEASFPGYAPIVNPTWDLMEGFDLYFAEALSQILSFEAGLMVTPQVITSVYLTQQKGTDPVQFFMAFPLPSSIVFDTAGQQYQKQVRVQSANLDAA